MVGGRMECGDDDDDDDDDDVSTGERGGWPYGVSCRCHRDCWRGVGSDTCRGLGVGLHPSCTPRR